MNDITNIPFIMAYRRSPMEYQSIIKDFMSLYHNDREEIREIIVKEFTDKPFRKETLDRLYLLHRDEINKVLNRLTAGVYTPRPTRQLTLKNYTTSEELAGKTDVYDEILPDILTACKYNTTVIDAYKKAKFVNTIIAHPVWRSGKLQIDILTGDSVAIKTKEDFYQIEEIKIQRAGTDGHIYYAVWNETEHYITDGIGNRIKSENNKDGKNPYLNNPYGISSLPFVVLRFVEGYDFWGEPNWTLYTHQLVTDVNLSDSVQGEFLQRFPMLLAIGGEIPQDQKVSPGNVITFSNKVKDVPGSLTYLESGTDWANIRENEVMRRAMLLNAMGIPEGSASLGNAPKQVGAKTIDELELQENREMDKEILSSFEIELLNVIRMVYNTYAKKDKLSDKGYFELMWSEDKVSDDVDTMIKRREHQLKNGIKTPVDFIMEDWEVSQEEALEIYEANKAYINTGQSRVQGILNRVNIPNA